jgi:hypothetical protein
MPALPVMCPCAWYREWRTGWEKLQERQKIIYTRKQIILDNATRKERNRSVERTFVDVISRKENLLLWIPNCIRKIHVFN